MLLHLAQVALFGLLATAAHVQRRATVCNGHEELCTRSYGTVSYVGAHNSYAVDGQSLSANQEYDVLQQLKDGIRLLQLQAHDESGTITLCHENCLLFSGGPLSTYLGKVKTWLDENPNEVLTILIVNRDNLPAASYAAVYEAADVADVSFAPTTGVLPGASWPTLSDMIDSGKRLVTFLDNGADFQTIPYLIDEFPNVWETAFDVLTQDFPCTVNRTRGDPTTQLYLINHFLYKNTDIVGAATSIAPDKDKLLTTNAVSGFGSLGQEVGTCLAQWGRAPTFLLVDFYHYGGGSVFQVAASINGVNYSPSSAVPPPLTSGSSSSADDEIITRPLNGALSTMIISTSALFTTTAFVVGYLFLA